MARVRECALQNVSGLAVLDDKATLMGTLSIRDLKVCQCSSLVLVVARPAPNRLWWSCVRHSS